MDTFLEVLKWIGIALAAGFVGYFGRYPAKILIDKIRGERKPASAITTVAEMDGGQIGFAKNRLKIEKKRAKQTAKMTKNAGKQ
jgi:hypothetical protein